MDEKQYYRILGVPRDASEKDIKKAFQALSKKYNPGKNPGNEEWAEKRKLEVVEAYDVLSNPESRAQYDLVAQKPVVAPAPIITPRNSALPVKPARVRTAPKNKVSRVEEHQVESKFQKEQDKKRRRRNTIFAISAITAIVAVIVLVFYLLTYVLPFQKVIARVDNQEVKMDYFIRRVAMNSEGSGWTTLQSVINEIIIMQEAPGFVGEVTETEIDDYMRATAQGDAESLTDIEYDNWLRQQLNVSLLTEQQFRDLFEATLLQSRMYSYLAERTSNTVPQAHMHYIFVSTYEEAVTAKERIDNGEDFAVIAKEISVDSSRTNGGDVGWTPTALLASNIQSAIVGLEIGKCSEPIAMANTSNPSATEPSGYALVKISEEAEAMEVTTEQLDGLRRLAFENWLSGYQTSKTITFHGIRNQYLDSETFAWVDYQVTRLLKGIKDTSTVTETATPTGGQ